MTSIRSRAETASPLLASLALAILWGLPGCDRAPAPPASGPAVPPAAAAPASGAPPIVKSASGVEMVLIPAGKFTLGDAKGAKDEGPPREVEISSFYMDRFEVTQGRFEKVTGYNPSGHERKDDAVDQVRWTEAIDYCNRLSEAEKLEPCYDLKTGACRFEASGYRLPTEAEWEYACRAGTTTRYFFGDDPAGLEAYAWFEKNAAKEVRPVGVKKANPWGLHDMAGSLLEWCNDRYAEDAYARAAAKDPTGPAEGKERVLRGGAWRMGADKGRSAIRFHDEPSNADSCFGWDSYGFRAVRRVGASR